MRTVANPNPKAALNALWGEWRIPLADFAGVNAAKVKKLVIGVGDRASPKKGGKGLVYIDDIRAAKSKPAPAK